MRIICAASLDNKIDESILIESVARYLNSKENGEKIEHRPK